MRGETVYRIGRGASMIAGLALFVLFPLRGALHAEEKVKWDGPKEGREELMRIKTACEEAVNENRPDKLLEYLGEDFRAQMVSGEEVKGRKGFQAFLSKISRIGREKKDAVAYRMKLHPEGGRMAGKDAFVRGWSEEEVTTKTGAVYKYRSKWTLKMEKTKDGWKLRRMMTQLHPLHKASLALQAVANEFLLPVIDLKRPRLYQPDFDRNLDTLYKHSSL